MDRWIEVSRTWEGRVIQGKFPLRKWIGGSGHSSVFLTERGTQKSEKAAIKLIPAEVFSANRSETDHTQTDHTQEDAQLSRWAESAKLSHPHLLRLYECGRCQMDGARLLYVVMEYAEEDLAQILPLRALTPAEVREMLPPTAEALAFLHRAGLAHGRIQPSNIMAADNQLKISADSLRKFGERCKRETTGYDAAEIGSVGLSPATDVWSLGVLLVAALTQHEPEFKDGNGGQVAIPETIPEPFHEIARRSLNPDPRQRCNVGDVVSMLKVPELPSAVPVEKPAATKRSMRWTVLAIAAALVLLAVLLARRWMVQPPPVPPEETHPAETQAAPANPQQSPPPFAEKAKPTRTGVVRGSVLQQVLPEVSRSAQDTITGRLKISVQLSVDASGKVSQAKLVSAGTSKYFANHALDAARRWKFDPPQVNGQPSPSEWLLRFQFGRTFTQVFPAEMKP